MDTEFETAVRKMFDGIYDALMTKARVSERERCMGIVRAIECPRAPLTAFQREWIVAAMASDGEAAEGAMICPRCYGTLLVPNHWSKQNAYGWIGEWLPCPDCLGGVVSCCDEAGAGIAEGGKADDERPPG